WANPPGVVLVALDGSATYPIPSDETQSFAGWDTEGNLLFHVLAPNVLEARTLDARVVYAVPLTEDLRDQLAIVQSFPQPRDMQVLSFYSGGCCRPSRHAVRMFFDRKIHE